MGLTIRLATGGDLLAITDIYNEAVRTTTATFDEEAKTLEERRAWFAAHTGAWPVYVAVDEEGRVRGWASLSKWSEKGAYRGTAELSFYVGSPHRGRGIGRLLMEAVIAHGREAGLHTLLARVAEGSEASLRLLHSAGFETVGVMREVGRKFGRLLDVHLLQLRYREARKRE